MHILSNRLRLFAHQHDDIPAFHAAYLVSTFLVAAIFNLGFFAILIVLHMLLDYVKYRDYFRFPVGLTIKAVLLESIVDIALFLLSMTFAVYLSTELAFPLLSGLGRSGLTILRALGTIVPKIHIAEHMLTIVLNLHLYLYTPHPDIRKPLSAAHRYSVLTSFLCLALLALSFSLFGLVDVLSVMQSELSLGL